MPQSSYCRSWLVCRSQQPLAPARAVAELPLVDTQLRAYSFYKEHGWRDWKIENGLRYMKKCA